MKIKLILIASLLLLATIPAPMAQTAALNPTVLRPQVTTGIPNPWLPSATDGTLEGTISVTVERNPKNFTCKDIAVRALRLKPGPTGVDQNQTVAAAQATGTISSGKCSYKLVNIPTRESLQFVARAKKPGPDYDCTKLEIRTSIPSSVMTLAAMQAYKNFNAEAICYRF